MMSGDYALKTRTNYKLPALSTGKVLIKPSHLSKPFGTGSTEKESLGMYV